MKDIKCPECSLSNAVEDGLEKFKCRYCGHEFEPRTVERAAGAGGEATDDGPTEETVLVPDTGAEVPGDGMTQETVLVSSEGQVAAAARKGGSRATDAKPSDALEPIESGEREEEDDASGSPPARSSRMGLAELGISESDLPEFDPETGRFHVDGRELTEGSRVFVYNDQGEPIFGYLFVDGSLVISPEQGAREATPSAEPDTAAPAAAEAEEPVSQEEPEAEEEPEAAVKEAEEKPEVRRKEKGKGKDRPAGTSTSARRARAAAKAATDLKKRKAPGRRSRVGKAGEPKPKSPVSVFATVMFSLSTLACLGFLVWWAVVGKDQVGGSGSSENGKTMTFVPQDFSAIELGVGEPLAVCQERLEEAGWEIILPSSNAQWALRQSGCIDSGVMKGGQIERTRKGRKSFRLSCQTGFLKLPDTQTQSQGNMSLLIEAPATRRKVYFGYGKELGVAFISIFRGSRKEDERRHDLPTTLKYNTWYQLRVEALGGYLNFYFNGMKVDGIEMTAKEITKISVRTVAARTMVRQFSLVEEGVRPEPVPEPAKE